MEVINKEYKYKFSVVIPIYNVEKYLEETILSVINQDIGFEKNIQMILVNDGSPDNSEKICLKYKELYPNNVIYIKQKNAGVSEARNTGMKYIEGKYTSFLDSDDKWEKDAFKKIYNFFEKNYDDIDLVSGRMKFFEARNDYHPLDYKFTGDRVIDIREEYEAIQLHITSSIIKSEILKDYKFDSKIKYGEDAKFVSMIVINKLKYGIVSDTTCYYRKRMNNSSAIQNKSKSKEWYIETPKYYYSGLIDYSLELYSKVIPYVQYIIMYDMQWRLREKFPEDLEDIKDEHMELITDLLKKIDDVIILEQKKLPVEYKIYALNLKYGRDIREEFTYKNAELYYNNLKVSDIIKKTLLINILEIEDNNLNLAGQIINILDKKDYEIYVLCDDKEKKKIDLFDLPNQNIEGIDRTVLKKYGYKISIPLDNKAKKIKIMIKYKDYQPKKLKISFGKFGKLNQKIRTSYYSKDKYIITNKKDTLCIENNSKINKIKHEFKYIKTLLRNKKFKVILYRLVYYMLKCMKKKEIWLVTDREDVAGDNGECIFEYIQKQKNKNIKSYFIISKKCEDYKRIKKIGKVIKDNSIKHKLYFLLSDKIISSQANEREQNAFKGSRKFLKDLYSFKFIFLQHGIIKDDLSKWLHKYNKNLSIFVTSAIPEYNSILNGNYLYEKDVVKLTGLPRFDKLENHREKNILISPTQRRKLAEWCDDAKKKRIYNPFFKESKFYKFYNSLLNDDRIIKVLKENNYKIKFCLHPLFEKQWIDFQENDYVEINQGFVDYKKEFSKASLLVTDYSSVFFDFAYLHKPVVYTQFDKEEFYEGQVYDEGYFDYERDGFGPVCYDYETTVNSIIKAVENDCKIEEKYLERIKGFYYKFDNNNCKRVYEEILKLR